MKFSIKRVLALMLVLVMALIALSGCNQESTKESEPTESAVSSGELPPDTLFSTEYVLGRVTQDDLPEGTIVQARNVTGLKEGSVLNIPIGSIPWNTLLGVPVLVGDTPCEVLAYWNETGIHVALNACKQCTTGTPGQFRQVNYNGQPECIACMDCGTILSCGVFGAESDALQGICHPYMIAREECRFSSLGDPNIEWNLEQYPWLSPDGTGYGVPPVDLSQRVDSDVVVVSYETLAKYISDFTGSAPSYQFSIPGSVKAGNG